MKGRTFKNLFSLLFTFLTLITVTKSAKNIEKTYEWGSLKIGGGGFVSAIIAGQREMYMRTDVGGAYKYDYQKGEWVQLFGFIKEENRGYLAIKGIAIDPTDDDIAYFLCGRADHAGKYAIFKTTDGGQTFKEIDISHFLYKL